MTELDPPIDILVLGLGNVLCGDDGAGVAAVHRLQRGWILPDRVRVVDGGTLGLDLLALVAAAPRVILVDAVRAEAAPGTVVVLGGDDVAPAVYERLSPHQIGVADLLAGAALCDRYPSDAVIVGVVPATTELQLGCSPPVLAAIPALIERVLVELAARGAPAEPRTGPAPARDAATRALGL